MDVLTSVLQWLTKLQDTDLCHTAVQQSMVLFQQSPAMRTNIICEAITASRGRDDCKGRRLAIKAVGPMHITAKPDIPYTIYRLKMQ